MKSDKKIYINMAKRLIKDLRGKYSQEIINNKMRHTSNKLSKWENGRMHISLQEFVKFCDCLNIDLLKILNRSIVFNKKRITPAGIIDRLMLDLSLIKTADKTGFSRSKITNWKNNSVKLTLADLLEFWGKLDKGSFNCFIFELSYYSSSSLITNGEIPFKQICYMILIYQLIQTQDYRNLDEHKEGYFSSKFKISFGAEKILLDIMISKGVVAKEAAKYVLGKSDLMTLIPLDRENRIEMILGVTYLCLENRSANVSSDEYIYSATYLASDKSVEEIRDKILTLLLEIDNICDADESNDNVSVLNIQFLNPLSFNKGGQS